MNPLYITEILVALVAGGVITRFIMRPKKPKPPKHRCPWMPCGYPLPDSPLIEKPETHSHYATYAEEECPGCGGAIKYNGYTGRYERFKTRKPVDKSKAEG